MERIFLVLEPNNHIYKVIELAASRGLHVVALHSTPLRAEGAYRAGLDAIAQRHEVESWDDEQAVFDWVISRIGTNQLAGTYAGYETVLPLQARIRQQFALPTESPERYRHLMRKPVVRQSIRDAGLSRLRTFDPRAVAQSGEWPLGNRAAFLKPVCGLGSFHVTRCTGVEDVRRSLDLWDRRAIPCRPALQLHLDRGGDLFLEEEAPGELMSVEGLVVEGRYHALGITSRTVLADDVAVEMGASFPYAHPNATRIVAKVAAIHQALGLRHALTHAEVVCGEDGDVELVEINLRFAGSDVLLLMEMTLPTSTTEVLFDMACAGKPRLPEPAHAHGGSKCASLQLLLPPQDATLFESLAVDDPAVVELRSLKPLGTEIKSHRYQSDQVALFIVVGDDYAAAVQAASRVRSSACINGSPIASEANNRVLLR